MSEEIIQQAKIAARNEKIAQFFAKNKKNLKVIAITLLAVIVLLTTTSLVYKARQHKFSSMLHRSLVNQQVGDLESAEKILKTIYEAKLVPVGVKSLASVRYAGFLMEKGKIVEAAAIYQDVHACTFCDEYLKNLSGLLLVKVWIANQDQFKQDDLVSRISKIESSSSALKNHIAEQKALVEMQKGNFDQSFKIFDAILASEDSSMELKDRAKMGIRILISKGFNPVVSNQMPK